MGTSCFTGKAIMTIGRLLEMPVQQVYAPALYAGSLSHREVAP